LRSKQDIRPALVALESENSQAIAQKFPELARLASHLFSENRAARGARGGNLATSVGERRTDTPRFSGRLDLAFRNVVFKTRLSR
jgi:xanthine dehydrogenase iron-sulfur cluster and FAD-binding subunit A